MASIEREPTDGLKETLYSKRRDEMNTLCVVIFEQKVLWRINTRKKIYTTWLIPSFDQFYYGSPFIPSPVSRMKQKLEYRSNFQHFSSSIIALIKAHWITCMRKSFSSLRAIQSSPSKRISLARDPPRFAVSSRRRFTQKFWSLFLKALILFLSFISMLQHSTAKFAPSLKHRRNLFLHNSTPNFPAGFTDSLEHATSKSLSLSLLRAPRNVSMAGEINLSILRDLTCPGQ